MNRDTTPFVNPGVIKPEAILMPGEYEVLCNEVDGLPPAERGRLAESLRDEIGAINRAEEEGDQNVKGILQLLGASAITLLALRQTPAAERLSELGLNIASATASIGFAAIFLADKFHPKNSRIIQLRTRLGIVEREKVTIVSNSSKPIPRQT